MTSFDQNNFSHKLVIPTDFVLRKKKGELNQIVQYTGQEDDQEALVIDIGLKSVEEINKI